MKCSGFKIQNVTIKLAKCELGQATVTYWWMLEVVGCGQICPIGAKEEDTVSISRILPP